MLMLFLGGIMMPVDFRLLPIIFRNPNNITFPPLFVVITIVNTDRAKENRTILEKLQSQSMMVSGGLLEIFEFSFQCTW